MRTAHDPGEATAAETSLTAALAVETQVRWAYWFGSAARGEPFHDLDVAVMLAPGDSQRGTWLGRLAARLQEAAGPLEVDIVDLRSAAPALRACVVRDGRLLVDRDPHDRRIWEIDVARRWLDLAPWLARQDELRREALLARVGGR
jgi:predicted nucleotidyltransferase